MVGEDLTKHAELCHSSGASSIEIVVHWRRRAGLRICKLAQLSGTRKTPGREACAWAKDVKCNGPGPCAASN